MQMRFVCLANPVESPLPSPCWPMSTVVVRAGEHNSTTLNTKALTCLPIPHKQGANFSVRLRELFDAICSPLGELRPDELDSPQATAKEEAPLGATPAGPPKLQVQSNSAAVDDPILIWQSDTQASRGASCEKPAARTN